MKLLTFIIILDHFPACHPDAMRNMSITLVQCCLGAWNTSGAVGSRSSGKIHFGGDSSRPRQSAYM